MTNEDHIDSYLEDHLADKAAKDQLAKEQEAREEAERNMRWNADRDNESFDRIARESSVLARIAAAVKVVDQKAVVRHEVRSGTITVDGINVTGRFRIEEERAHQSKWRSSPTGKYRVVVGDYGHRTSYPQRKDGGHNYEAIAHCLLGHARQEIANTQARAVAEQNAWVAEKLVKELRLPRYYGAMSVRPSADQELPVFVQVEFKKAMTMEQVLALGEALIALGIVRQEEVKS